jgi:hypothetical protein
MAGINCLPIINLALTRESGSDSFMGWNLNQPEKLDGIDYW